LPSGESTGRYGPATSTAASTKGVSILPHDHR
jgi:hypothetical protein